MAEVVQRIQELKSLPPDLHWFCPRQDKDDFSYYYEEDIYNQLQKEDESARSVRKDKIKEAEERKIKVLDALAIFAFDGLDALEYQKDLKARLEDQLTSCDVCIRIYHGARNQLRSRLEEQYDPEEVAAFLAKFDGINIERISAGLDHAKAQLLKLPEEKRRVSELDPTGIFAIFECLSCEPYLRNEQMMVDHFDEPFRLVQTKKRLKLTNFLPAFTVFLFGTNQFRYDWAWTHWPKIDRPPTGVEFEWAIRKPLLAAMSRVQMTSLEVRFLSTFWSGAKIIFSRLSKDLVTHHVRALELSIYRLTLDHFSLSVLEPRTFGDLLFTFKLLVGLSPTDFWDSMRSISPPIIVEQIFKSPTLDRILSKPDEVDMPKLEDIFAWIPAFLDSIKPANQIPACRSLVTGLIKKSQDQNYAPEAQSYCFSWALRVLKHTLRNLNKERQPATYVGAACVGDMLEMVNQQLPSIIKRTKGAKTGAQHSEDTESALKIVESSIALDCLALVMDREAILKSRERQEAADRASKVLWTTVTGSINAGDQALAAHSLLGARELIGLEKIGSKVTVSKPGAVSKFNTAYETKYGYVTGVLERLSDFASVELAAFFQTVETATSIVVTLLSSEDGTRQAAVDLLKTMSEKETRREALGHIFQHAFLNMLVSLNSSIKSVTKQAIFSPMPAMIKLCRDVIDVLCNPQDGMLRSRDINDEELKATKELWSTLWKALHVIFQRMESWSEVGHDKAFMMDFCRDIMQFADMLFNEYSVFVSAIVDEFANEEQNKAAGVKLLQYPNHSMNEMVKWLRLRDEYLSEKSVELVCGLLGRLRNADIEVEEEPLNFIERILQPDKSPRLIKNKLSMQQKAELGRAFEDYTGRSLTPPEPKKQGSLQTWAGSSGQPIAIDGDSDVDAEHKRVIAGATTGQDHFKRMQASKKASALAALKAKSKQHPTMDIETIKSKRAQEAEDKKRRDAAAIAAAKALRTGGLTGAGSALGSLGAVGKDHSARGTGMMVSSDESDDDDDDGLDEELFGPRKGKSSKPVDPRLPRMIAQEVKGPVKIRRIQRSAKDMSARLAPNLSNLHKEILGWDFFHTGEDPPGSRPDRYQKVSNSFRDPTAYKNTFEPLLVMEAWTGLAKAKEENSSKPFEIKVQNCTSVDAFREVNATLGHTENLEAQISEGDIILFSKGKTPLTASDQPNCLARVFKIARKKQFLDVTYRVVPGRMGHSLAPGATVYALKITSVIPLERQYGALMGLQYYDLCDYITKAEPSHLLQYKDQVLEPFMNNYHLNKAQAKAVKSAVDNDAFTLIQGPPGSGKTKTIVAIVGSLLSESLREQGTAINRPGMDTKKTSTSKKLLVCAPSNAAVDELVMRFKEGVKTTSGQVKQLNVVRLGRSDNINSNVTDVVLGNLVNARLSGNNGKDENQREETQKLFQEHKEVSGRLNEARDRLNAEQEKGLEAKEAKTEFEILRRRKTDLSRKIDEARDKENQKSRTADLERKRVQQAILNEAHIICGTLSGSGHDMFQKLDIEFETVIVDEAAQCVEMEVLIPLKYGCAKCILVGDPKQLPPTVFSKLAAKYSYEQSLFVRMQGNRPQDVHLLDTQYRMHPEISLFPSKSFYDGKLLDGPDMAKLRIAPWHTEALLGPYRFFDVQGQHSAAPKGHSLINVAEIDVALQLVEKLTASVPTYNFKGKIGIITPYKSQLRELKERFSRHYGKSVLDSIDFNTTDAFQGRESEVIIFSCVRAAPSGGVGFLSDVRRMNVGLTRAKSSLFVLGNSESLMRGEFWKKMIDDAKARDRHSSAKLIVSMKGSKGSMTALASNTTPSAPKIMSSVPVRMEANKDVVMSNSGDPSSRSGSRQSSVESTMSSKMGFKNEASLLPVKQESWMKQEEQPLKRKFDEDIDMKDLFSEDEDKLKEAPIKEEKPIIKEESKPTPPAPVTKADPSAPRPPGLKRRKAAANPFMQPNRPKKPKTG
ncbi:hypothetical protein EG327_001232 [Venturia inaequalis]|uniref:Uncharacterized protein n=1 Tax=Venturia inaequalis TaxID=5025 RepID=A0A8H3VPK6_VENIN|nr:hypothetical protein EG327_001232 [Venturia inaequalis]